MPRKYRKSKNRKMKRRAKRSIPRTLAQHFPPSLRTRLTMNTAFPMTGVLGGLNNNANYAFFKLNSILSCGPALQASTAVAPIGFSDTFPSGINYLLSSSTNTNTLSAARAPYQQFLVLGSSITLKMSSIGNAHSTQVCIYPSSENWQTSGLGQSIENLGEQPLSKKTVVNSVTAAEPCILRHSCSTAKAFGLTRRLATNDDQYLGEYNSNPSQVATWVIGMNNLGSALINTVFTVDCQATITYDVIFFDRNLFGSVTPI